MSDACQKEYYKEYNKSNKVLFLDLQLLDEDVHDANFLISAFLL